MALLIKFISFYQQHYRHTHSHGRGARSHTQCRLSFDYLYKTALSAPNTPTIKSVGQKHTSAFFTAAVTDIHLPPAVPLYVHRFQCVCTFTWISILVYVSISSHGVSKASRHVAGCPFALQDLRDEANVVNYSLSLGSCFCTCKLPSWLKSRHIIRASLRWSESNWNGFKMKFK